MKAIRVVAALGLVVLGGCALFGGQNTTAGLQADQQRVALQRELGDAFRQVVQSAQGWTPEQKAQVLETIENNWRQYLAFAQREQKLLAEIGNVEWQTIAGDALELWLEWDGQRRKNGGEDG